MKNTILITVFGACGLFVACAQPTGEKQKGKRPSPEKVFERLDSDSDGYISYEEFKLPPKRRKNAEANREKAPSGGMKQNIFSKIDADGDGKLSKDEFTSHRPPRPRKRDRQ